jgi:hypothetical protein|tara:strand:+ start:7672 stop:8052 length:381 start_codon:yes stop_codon:yes gene_type:complete
MHDLPTTAALEQLLEQQVEPSLRTILEGRLHDTIECSLQDLTHVLVIEADDTEEAVIEAIGFSPLRSRIDPDKNGPNCDWLEKHPGWCELIFTVGNAGFAYIVLIEDSDRSPFAVRCRRWGVGAAK